MCAGKIFWGGLVEYRLVMSLVQGTNGQGEMCTEGSKVTALRVLTLLRHAMVEREDGKARIDGRRDGSSWR